ncbi:MAG: Gfo/Idh/MocA family protein [Acidimicrobiales bacterium]
MRVGVVGCGYWGSNHVRVFSNHPAVSQVVIIDDRPEIREAVGANFPDALQRATLREALDDIDAVVVATPPETHFDITAAAIAAGKHALVEKPMATTTADAAELVRMADAAGVTLAAGHTFAHNAAVLKLAELANAGDFGKLHFIDAARLNLGLYRQDVNVLWDLAAHDISIAKMIIGDVPDTVAAWGTRHTTGYSEDAATLRMSFANQGIEATVRASWLDPLKVRKTTIVGSEKMAVYDDIDVDARVRVYEMGRELHRRPDADSQYNVTYRNDGCLIPTIDFQEPLHTQASDFLESCETGRSPVADGRDGLAVVAILEASDRSLQENGMPITVDLAGIQPKPKLVHRLDAIA